MLEHLGSTVADRRDHLVVRTSANADFHWDKCIFVTDADALDDAARWVDAFEAAVPGADWIAIGLPRMPADAQVWTRCGIELELDDVLATTSLPPLTTPPLVMTCGPSSAATGAIGRASHDVHLANAGTVRRGAR